MNALQTRLSPSSCACFVVYIAEAHSRDEWPVGATISRFDQPRTLDERRVLAALTAVELGIEWPIFVDSLADGFGQQLGAWPTRLYLFEGRRLAHINSPLAESFGHFAATVEARVLEQEVASL